MTRRTTRGSRGRQKRRIDDNDGDTKASQDDVHVAGNSQSGVQHISHVSGNDFTKCVFISLCRNKVSDDAALTADGRAFHVRAADTGSQFRDAVCTVTMAYI